MSAADIALGRQMGAEEALWLAIDRVADALVALGEHVWNQGDGAGGAVFQAVAEAAGRRALRVGDSYRGPR